MTAMNPTIATARNKAGPLAPPPVGAATTAVGIGVTINADVGDSEDGTADGATGLTSGGSVPGGGVISGDPPEAVSGASSASTVPCRLGFPRTTNGQPPGWSNT